MSEQQTKLEQQTRLESFTEAAVNTVLGYVTAMITQVIFYPVFNIHVSMSDQLLLALLFTLVSLLRNYFVRRVFNNHYKAMLQWLNDGVMRFSKKYGKKKDEQLEVVRLVLTPDHDYFKSFIQLYGFLDSCTNADLQNEYVISCIKRDYPSCVRLVATRSPCEDEVVVNLYLKGDK